MIRTLLARIYRGKTWRGIVAVIIVCSCSLSPEEKEAVLYETYSASCHKAPGVYASHPLIKAEDWQLLKENILKERVG